MGKTQVEEYTERVNKLEYFEGIGIFHIPFNRQEIRLAVQEFDKIFPELHQVEERFVEAIFTDKLKYMEAYRQSCEKYEMICKSIVHNVKVKFFYVNIDYFKNKYKPLEREKTISL